MSENITIQIEQVQKLKSGQSAQGKPWTLYKVIDADGNQYTTFDKKVENLDKKTQQVEYEVQERTGQDGNVHKNNFIKRIGEKSSEPQGTQYSEQQIANQLVRILNELGRIATALESLNENMKKKEEVVYPSNEEISNQVKNREKYGNK